MSRPNLVTMKLHKNKVLVTMSGLCVQFIADTEVQVPKHLVREALEIGAVVINDDKRTSQEILEDVTREQERSAPVTDPVERENAIREAIAVITATNSREDFTGTGTPHAKSVSKLLAFTVQQKDVNEVWRKIREEAVEE